jgi:tRNA dimethylallyltransferase
LKGSLSLDETLRSLKNMTHRYAKRQMTWFKRDKRIHWIDGKDYAEAQRLIEDFLKI